VISPGVHRRLVLLLLLLSRRRCGGEADGQYLDPVRAKGLPHDERASDVWSLGVSLSKSFLALTWRKCKWGLTSRSRCTRSSLVERRLRRMKRKSSRTQTLI